ncbi:MFS transporter [Nitrospirillum iridis]|uniref:Na+/melibiose symporter-like transporter n=1 Tax=Nitrospirillum iridis TaxID=765888 RepID=A0A7X0AVP1_9PROT|nr:MFS transporter [Nitrospirillum iridis]MBB6250987.1 Na+/melibiose symporter-like transporter [Nitrospirillum iridis]
MARMDGNGGPGWVAVLRVPLWRAYALGHYCKSLIWYSSELLFAYFLTEACGLAPRAMGGVLAFSLVVNGATDLVIGHALRIRAATVPAAASLHFRGSVLAGAALLLFLSTGLIPPGWRLAYALGTGLLFRLAYALYDVPQNAVLGMVAGDGLRTRLSALRFVGAGLATLTIAGMAPVFLGGDMADQAVAFWVFALVLWGLGVISAAGFRRVARAGGNGAVAGIPSAFEKGAAPVWPMRFPVGLATVLVAEFVLSGSASVFTRLEPYFAASVLQSPMARGTVMVTVAIGGLAGQAVWAVVAERRGPAVAFRGAAAVAMAGGLAFLLLGDRGAAWIAMAGGFLGAGLGGVSMLLWAAAGACVGTTGVSGHRWAPTQVFGLLTFCIKVACAVAVLVVGEVLAWREGAPGGMVVPPVALIAPMTLLPALGATVCLALASRLRLS